MAKRKRVRKPLQAADLPALAARIKERVIVTAVGCWEWQGMRFNLGYGRINSYPHQTMFSVHRLMLQNKVGRLLTQSECACHACDNRICCNPEHLWIGTRRENIHDSVNKGRHFNQNKTHCKRGHEFTPDNTHMSKHKGGTPHRSCRICMDARNKARDTKAEWQARKAAPQAA